MVCHIVPVLQRKRTTLRSIVICRGQSFRSADEYCDPTPNDGVCAAFVSGKSITDAVRP